MRLAFFGTPAVAEGTLRHLVGVGHDVVLAVTRPDARRSRSARPEPSPVAGAARELGIPVTDKPGEAAAVGAEMGVVVAYGRLLRPELLAVLPMVNVHFSLLPRWRGAAPVERAILAGDAETGVCLMEVEEGLDTGGVYARVTTPIHPDESAAELTRRLGQLGRELLVERLSDLGAPVPQEGEVTYAEKVETADRRLDFSRPAVDAHRQVRVGRAWTTMRGSRLLVLQAAVIDDVGELAPGALAPGGLGGPVVATSEGALELRVVQPEGRKAMDGPSWYRGVRLSPDERLGT